MNTNTLACKSDRRREQVRRKGGWKGIDYVDVSECQVILTVYFLGKAPRHLQQENVRIEGGRRVTDIQVTGIEVHREEDPGTDDYVRVFIDKYGDFSNYRLRVIDIDRHTSKPVYSDTEPKTLLPMHGFDPRYSSVEFTFKASCPSDLDCKTPSNCTSVV